MNNRALVVGLFSLLVSSTPVQAQCGGEDRWAVKVVADPGRGMVAPDAPIPISLADLVRITRPPVPKDDTSRLSAEYKVYVVDAHLVKFKKESGKTGDSDFHLVLSDQTGLYSEGGASKPVSPHSVIAEIPDPACVAGRKATVTVPSRFQTQLEAVRAQFESHFDKTSAGWVDAGGLPVRVTGVAFFDRPHGQVGRALNGIELHPLLSIDFNPSVNAVGRDSGAASEVALQNANFEAGDTGWHASQEVITDDSSEAAHSGRWKAWLAGYGERRRDHVWQEVTVPATAASVALTFFLRVESEEESSRPLDRLFVRVRDASGALLATLETYSNIDARSRYVRHSLSLSPYKGQAIRIAFESSEDEGSATSFLVDDVRIIATKR